MKTNHNIRSRMANAQMRALAAVRKDIRSDDTASKSKYLRDFTQSFRNYESVLTSEQFHERIMAADIVLVGDYHSLPASQQFTATLIEQISPRRSVVLGVEAVFSRDQEILDSWWRRETSEDGLRQQVRFDRDWGYQWAPFYKLLMAAREHGERVYGLDCEPRDDLRSIRSRDSHAAAQIGNIRQKHREATIVAVFGESHMAPKHLPARLRAALPNERIVTVLQNIDTLYWRTLGENATALSMGGNTLCVFNSTPLEKYESYRLCLEEWNSARSESVDFAPAVYNVIFSLARTLGFRLNFAHNGTQPKLLSDFLPEVITVEEEANEVFAPAKLAAEFAGPGAMRRRVEQIRAELVGRLDEQACVYVAAANRFYVREFRLPHIAAEAARFLYRACAGVPRSLQARKRDDALAGLGSQLLCPGKRENIHHAGDELYQSYIEGRTTSAAIRKLFLNAEADLRG